MRDVEIPPSDWQLSDMTMQGGKVAVVTGTGGLGLEIARGLATGGALIVLAGRNPMKGSEALADIRRSVPGAKVTFERVDLASLADIVAFTSRLQKRRTPIDLLVNNAGVMMPRRRQITTDGFELQFGVNHLASFALTMGLMELLLAASAPRVVTMSSGAHSNHPVRAAA